MQGKSPQLFRDILASLPVCKMNIGCFCRVVGPQFLATGAGTHDFFALDGKGVLSKVDLQPVIHCGNQVPT